MALIDHLETLREHANNFVTHWMDDDDPEDHARALDAERDVDTAHTALDDALKVSGLMLAALNKAHDMIGDYQRHGCPAGVVAVPSVIRDAIAQAQARGITLPAPADDAQRMTYGAFVPEQDDPDDESTFNRIA